MGALMIDEFLNLREDETITWFLHAFAASSCFDEFDHEMNALFTSRMCRLFNFSFFSGALTAHCSNLYTPSNIIAFQECFVNIIEQTAVTSRHKLSQNLYVLIPSHETSCLLQ